jgi:hypothetical protein
MSGRWRELGALAGASASEKPTEFGGIPDALGMPAKSKKQQMAAGAALAAKRGEKSKTSLKGASKGMAKSMSKKQLEEFASTKRKKLPTKKKASK